MKHIFPYLEISGTYRQIGKIIGENFRDNIQQTILFRKTHIRKYDQYREKIQPYFQIAREKFPDYIEELTGICEGANVPVPDLFFHNTGETHDYFLEVSRQKAETEDHCTVVVSRSKEGSIIGHNEDWAIESIDELYILKATIGNLCFIGLNYASYIPGISATLNSYGLVQCINEIHQTTRIGVPKNFIARAVIECPTIDHAVNLIQSTPRASGYNHVLVQGKELCDIEIAKYEIDVERRIVSPYVHTNHFISKRMQKYENDWTAHVKNSHARYIRAKELIKPIMDASDMQYILSDIRDPLYPICRKDATIGSVIIEPSKKVFTVCYGPPCLGGEYRSYTL